MTAPHSRRLRFADRASLTRALALFICLLTLGISSAGALAADDGATVHIHGAAGTSDDAVYAVDAREYDYPTPEPAPSAGEQVVAFAMAYVGYPYVAGGNTPAGFDCSGFTEWVVLNVLGIDIGHAVEGQPGAGGWVDYGGWQPGDLIFFQNTYRDGISHVGIYIGDGLIVHAENEGTGVTISSVYSDYYGPRYWGAIGVG